MAQPVVSINITSTTSTTSVADFPSSRMLLSLVQMQLKEDIRIRYTNAKKFQHPLEWNRKVSNYHHTSSSVVTIAAA